MKTAIMSYGGIFIAFLTFMILTVIIMKSSYDEMITQNLNESMEYSIYMLQRDRALLKDENKLNENLEFSNWTVTSDNDKFKQEFISYFTKNLSSTINDVDIDIYGADADAGVLSARIKAYFKYPVGQEGYVTVNNTIILNREKK